MTGKVLGALSLFMMVLLLTGCPDPTAPSAPDYPRILIDTYSPLDGGTPPDTTLRLYDASGTLLASDDGSSSADGDAHIDYTTGLDVGTYYIKITGDSGGAVYYAIRALSLSLGETPPAYNYPGALSSEDETDGDDADTDNVPDAPKDISLGNANRLNRAINPVVPVADIDWLRLELP